jgi:hypothetical protein
MFQDDLLLRSPHGFELTLRGGKILQELEGLPSRMENLVTPNLFDPTRDKLTLSINNPNAVEDSIQIDRPLPGGSTKREA